jgi:hypothetical protein
MRTRSPFIAVLLLASAIAGVAGAQTRAVSPSADAADSQQAQTSLLMQKYANVSQVDAVAGAKDLLASVVGTANQVGSDYKGVVRDGDSLKGDCLSERLSEVNALQDSSKARTAGMEADLLNKKSDTYQSDLAIMVTSKVKADGIGAKAKACIGKELALVNGTQVTPTYPNGVPGGKDAINDLAPQGPTTGTPGSAIPGGQDGIPTPNCGSCDI